MDTLASRERRRDSAFRHGRRRQRLHLALIHAGDGTLDCACEGSAWMFAKKKHPGACGCRKRRRGQPKFGPAGCFAGQVRPGVVERRAGARLCRAWRGFEGSLDECEA